MIAPELLGSAVGGFVAGAGAMLGFLRIMIRGALTGFELKLTEKFDKRYVLLPQHQERA